jgi:outer membrane protein assembly factor BamB
VAQDPDAIWKPGYTGEIVYPAPPPESPPRRRPWLVGIGVVAAAAAVVGVTVSRLAHDRDAGGSSTPDRIPTQLRERWTTTLDRPVVTVTGTEDVIVALAGGELVTLDPASGSERWRVPAPAEVGELEVIDGVVVFHDVSPDGSALAAFDVDDGRRVWSKTLRRGPDVTLADDELVVPGFGAGGMVSSLEFLDPRTGDRRAAFEGEEISMSSTAIRRRVDDRVEWYDRDTFDLRASVDLAALGLDRFRTEGAPMDAGLVIATFDRAWLLDSDGAVVSSLSFSTNLRAPWSLDELDGSGRYVALQGVNATTMLTVRDGELHELWTRPVAPVEWMTDYSRTIFTTEGWNDGGPLMQVVDAATGRAIFSVRPPRLNGRSLRSNGFVAGTEARDDGTWTAVGYDFDGRELWRLPVPDRGWPTLLPGALLTVGYDAEVRTTRLTLLS